MNIVNWTENNHRKSAYLVSENKFSPPGRIVVADDTMKADLAFRLACEGTGILWRGDFQNARQLMMAMSRRANPQKRRHKKKKDKPLLTPKDIFLKYRLNQAHLARILGLLFVEVEEDLSIDLRRAPDVKEALRYIHESAGTSFLIPFRELLGIIGAFQWRKKGIHVSALDSRIYPHYGVFAPVRQEYVDLVADADIQPQGLAVDIGTGTGVLAAILARKGFRQVLATDNEPRAILCAQDNITRLGLDKKVQVIESDLFPEELSGRKVFLAVCNPPWIPLKAQSSLERAVYDPKNKMLYGFLKELPEYLDENGEGWLILSNLPELVGLRSEKEVLEAFAQSGLKVKDRIDAPVKHPRSNFKGDPLHMFRKQEMTSLWRLTLFCQ